MGVSANIALISGIASLLLTILFAFEASRGVRFGDSMRSVFDRLLVRIEQSVRRYVPPINSLFFQELFYYILHIALSRFLNTIRSLEHFILRVVRFNRMKAMRLRSAMDTERKMDPHFAEIAEHKKSVELSPKERARHKEESIESSGPF